MCDYATESVNDALIILAELIDQLKESIDENTQAIRDNKKKLSYLMKLQRDE